MSLYTTLTNFSTEYLMMCKVYADVGGTKYLNHVCPSVCKIIHSLKLVDYLNAQADNQWYNYYLNSAYYWFNTRSVHTEKLFTVIVHLA